MPKSTFFNLPIEKQKKIIDLGYEEFANNVYEKANIRNIIKKATIAIGSFYRYFDSKDEFYLYIIDYKMKEFNSKGLKSTDQDETSKKFWMNFFKSGSEIRKKFYFRFENNPLFTMKLQQVKDINSPYLTNDKQENALAFVLTVMPYVMHELSIISGDDTYYSQDNSDMWLYLSQNILQLFSGTKDDK